MNKQSKRTPDATFGPYSAWPRRQISKRVATIGAAGVAATAVFAHCIIPML